MSAISQLLLNRFLQNFKRRFLELCWTNSMCQSDICPGNICPCNICPYQDYISCYWLDCDQTSKVGYWDHLWQKPAVIVIFVEATATVVLATFVHITNVSAVTDQILTKLGNLNFWNHNFFGTDFFCQTPDLGLGLGFWLYFCLG